MTSLLPLPHPRAELSLTSWQGNHRSIIRVMVSLSRLLLTSMLNQTQRR